MSGFAAVDEWMAPQSTRSALPARNAEANGTIRTFINDARLETRPAPSGFALLDPRQWKEPAKPREWIVPDWIPRGLVTALYGDGGVGKSLLAMQLMSSVALGRPWQSPEAAPWAFSAKTTTPNFSAARKR
jgi:Cdc6-like AAA superfamily ATPase